LRLSAAEVAARGLTVESLDRSLALLGSTPNCSYWERLAEADAAGQERHLQEALLANPRQTSARLTLALLEESRDDQPRAEQSYLAAQRLDRQYLPAWTLAGYYYRRQRQQMFWTWASRAADLNYDDPRPLLRLASSLEEDPESILRRLGGADRLAYALLDVLSQTQQFDQAQQLGRIFLKQPRSPALQTRLLDLSTRQLAAGNVAYAQELWNALPPPQQDLAETPDGQGFRPKLVDEPGVREEWSPGQLWFTLEGTQPDVCPLLEKPVPVPAAAGQAVLQLDYRTSATGITFDWGGWTSPELAPSADWKSTSWRVPFRANGKPKAVPLRLLYRRNPGATPARGDLSLRALHLTIP
jgi:hypothetical protein